MMLDEDGKMAFMGGVEVLRVACGVKLRREAGDACSG
jgi:hypothetical protein